MIDSRSKGARGEREAAAKMRELGFPGARRGQQFAGGPDSPDLADVIEGVHVEVKRVESLSLYKAMAQAIADAGPVAIPTILHKRNGREWLVVLRADDLIEFCRRTLYAQQRAEDL